MHGWKSLSAGVLTCVTAAVTAFFITPKPTRSQISGPANFIDVVNGEGVSRTLTTARSFDQSNPFFQTLGTNGRTCATCHPIGQGMIVTPDYALQVFNATQGLDPLFAPIDGANAPTADMSTLEARQASCSLLLTKGLFRIGLPVPANAEFTLQAADDPYGYASAKDLSCFRRPLPVTNLRFLGTVMWDGRELAGKNSLRDALASQITDAVLGHMQAAFPPTTSQIDQIINFETQIYTAQIYDDSAGHLDLPQIGAGPSPLPALPFAYGINDAFGFVPNRQPFHSEVFGFYEPWLTAALPPQPATGPRGQAPPPPPPTAAQQSVARGERLFNTRVFAITGVAGLNDVLGKASISGTCSSCHSTPSVGGNALPLLLRTGIADGSLRTPDMPLYTLRNRKTGETVQTTDPGAAMTTGKWSDIGKFKVPSLRGLETNSPYMHNGFSGELLDILNFYDTRFSIGLTAQEKADLKAFLVTL